MSLEMNRRELLRAAARAGVIVGTSGAAALIVPGCADTADPTAALPVPARRGSVGPRIGFIRVPLTHGIVVHAASTSQELYHQHPHLDIEEMVQPDDIRLQTRLTMRNHKEVLDWAGLDWRNVVKVTRYQKRMSESKQIEEVMASYDRVGNRPLVVSSGAGRNGYVGRAKRDERAGRLAVGQRKGQTRWHSQLPTLFTDSRQFFLDRK
jgi:hypothetical protein